MAENNKEKPKIIADDDWKTQAQAEKEKIAEQVESGEAAGAGQHELPQASFVTLVSQLATQIIFALGGVEDPRTKKRYVDLALAKYHIDTLAMLEEKTKGNLTEEEKKLLDKTIYEVRMQFVQIAQMATKM